MDIVLTGSIPVPSTKIKKLYIYIKMKKVLFITTLVILASCSNETSTSSTDSTYVDTCNIDSLLDISKAHIDTMSVLLEEIKN